MKIGILTQPLLNNYGGILQAYALKEVLLGLGHEVVIINRQKRLSRIRLIASKVKSVITGRKVLRKKHFEIISENTSSFRKKYIPNLSHLITSDKGMLALNKLGFDAYIVGSDQCWRPRYSPKIENYFLDFAEKESNLKRIAYAVSFGVTSWEFDKKDTEICSRLVKKFDAISVREDSGVTLVNDYLFMKAVHVLDPTMLLSKEHYMKIVNEENQPKSEGNLKSYIFHKSQQKQKIIASVEKKLGLTHFEVFPNKIVNLKNDKNIKEFIYPNPAKWLKGYQDAKFVITDSFHGTVFSILFNVPFLVISDNVAESRFTSLLKMFGLEDRIITNADNSNLDTIIKSNIDWNKINETLKVQKQKSIRFLVSSLE